MRTVMPLLALMAVGGCGPKASPEAAATARSVHPDLHCAADTIPAGKAPPEGYEVWCQQMVGQSGTWVRQGPSISWHANEERKSEGAYESGRKSGPWLYWYATGTNERQGSYVRGVEDGVWVSYHPNGARQSEGEMVDGKQHGAWTYWDETGTSRTEGSWILGEQDGVWLEYDVDDNQTTERIYRTGRLVSQSEQ